MSRILAMLTLLIALYAGTVPYAVGADGRAEAMRSLAYDIFGNSDPVGYSRGPTGSELAWGESYILMGLVSAYEATGDTLFLNRLCAHADSIFAIRDDVRGIRDEYRERTMPAWSSSRYSEGRQFAWIVHAGMVSFPLARFAYLARRDTAIAAPFGARADRIGTVSGRPRVIRGRVVDGPEPGEATISRNRAPARRCP